MKRMYVTLFILAGLPLWAVTSFGQKAPAQKNQPLSHADSMQRRMELRAEMHRRMLEKLFNGTGPDDDLFKDMEQMFEQSMAESLKAFDQMDANNLVPTGNLKMEWKEGTSGRTLEITPETPSQQLDINVQNEMITVKGKREVKDQTISALSSFSQSFPVPGDCDGSKVKINQKDGKILIEMPYRVAKAVAPAPKKEERKPLGPGEDDITI